MPKNEPPSVAALATAFLELTTPPFVRLLRKAVDSRDMTPEGRDMARRFILASLEQRLSAIDAALRDARDPLGASND